jgi:hypothetical protein
MRCVCPPSVGGREAAAPQSIVLLGAGAAASVLSQALMFSLLPLVGRMLAPAPWLGALPFLAFLVGAVAATFPAALLTDAFGRRAAFALGASLGVAGGLVVAWGIVHAAFAPLAVGAFWIGTANGFALQYRHAAASGGSAAQTVAVVLGAGALIGVLAPSLAGFAEDRLTPLAGAGSAVLAAVAHVGALGAALLLPAGGEQAVAAPVRDSRRFRDWLVPTAAAAAAWFVMTAVMGFAPIGLAGCGLGFPATVGLVSWHLVAMYAPALAVGLLAERVGAAAVAGAGLVLGAAALLASALASVAGIGVALVAAGAGWSLATSGAVLLLHRAPPGRIAIAAHDACVLAAGIAGAVFAGQLG